MEARSASSGRAYAYLLEADYANTSNKHYFLAESEFIHPKMCYTKAAESEHGILKTTYLIEIFDANTPRYMVKKKIKGYINFLDSNEWEEGAGDRELPIVHIACPSTAELIYAKRYTRKLLEDIDQEDNEDICIRFATAGQIRKLGVTGKIWEDV